MMDHLTILTTAGLDRNKVATKRISRTAAGELQIQEYSLAKWWSVQRIEVDGFGSLGQALASLEADRRDEHDAWLSGEPIRRPERSCVIRGEPIAGINFARTRRLKDADPEDGTSPSFTPAARYHLAVDVDSLPAPIWNPEKLAKRRAAIERDRAEHGVPLPKGDDEGEDRDVAADADPAPIDPVRDWAISIRAAVIALPVEFHDASAYWQMTSGAGIKPGIRLRLWQWCDRRVSDAEAKRWLKNAPVDLSLYSAVTPHYTAAPIFDPPDLDPVPLRSGFWWRHRNVVTVPPLKEKPTPTKQQERRAKQKYRFTDPNNRAQRYHGPRCPTAVGGGPVQPDHP
jgi:hypothetical protein